MSYLKIAGPWLDAGAKLEGGMGGDTPPPPKYESSGLAGRIISGLAGQSKILNDRM
jgi:hypothetical protein